MNRTFKNSPILVDPNTEAEKILVKNYKKEKELYKGISLSYRKLSSNQLFGVDDFIREYLELHDRILGQELPRVRLDSPSFRQQSPPPRFMEPEDFSMRKSLYAEENRRSRLMEQDLENQYAREREERRMALQLEADEREELRRREIEAERNRHLEREELNLREIERRRRELENQNHAEKESRIREREERRRREEDDRAYRNEKRQQRRAELERLKKDRESILLRSRNERKAEERPPLAIAADAKKAGVSDLYRNVRQELAETDYDRVINHAERKRMAPRVKNMVRDLEDLREENELLDRNVNEINERLNNGRSSLLNKQDEKKSFAYEIESKAK